MLLRPLIGEAIQRIHRGESVGALFGSDMSLVQEMVLWEDKADGNAPSDATPAAAGAAKARS